MSGEGKTMAPDAPAAGSSLAGELARFGFGGRVAVWGLVLPLGALVATWSALLARGDEDAAIAFGGKCVGLYAWWLGGIVAALTIRRIVSHSLLARRRRARREAFHRLLAEEYGHPPSRLGPEPRPAVTLAEVIVTILIFLMILALAAPAAGSTHGEDFALFGSPLAVLGAAGLLISVALRRGAACGKASRERFEAWKARRARMRPRPEEGR